MSVALRPYTYADLADLPDDGTRYEILGGELLVSPAPSRAHQDTLAALLVLFRQFVVTTRLGKVYMAPLDVKLSAYTTVQPDLLYISGERLRNQGPGAIAGAPELALEVLSPTTRSVDMVRKFAAYAAAGIQEYWIVDPTRYTISVHALVDGTYERVEDTEETARSVVLAGLEIVVADVFAEVDREEMPDGTGPRSS
ncbi:MAG: Uma2 family endonuclease [Chloroflexota bacterium]|nr:Uma2 family endonuclease [Chloroflexota bacterium]